MCQSRKELMLASTGRGGACSSLLPSEATLKGGRDEAHNQWGGRKVLEGRGLVYKRHKHAAPREPPPQDQSGVVVLLPRLAAGSRGGHTSPSYLPLSSFLLLSISILSPTALFVVELFIRNTDCAKSSRCCLLLNFLCEIAATAKFAVYVL